MQPSSDAPRVLILADTPGWIVDRVTDEMIRRIPCQFTKRHYAHLSTDALIELANHHDLVHYQNWDWKYHLDRIGEIRTPILTSIRSFRFPEYVLGLRGRVHLHVINPKLLTFFPEATYIPNGVFDLGAKEFVVGFAGRPDAYKGYDLIARACAELGVTFKPALDLPPDQMRAYYDSIDLYVCASVEEGHSTPVMECLSLNKPVITTDVGIPSLLDVFKIERSVEGIKKGILRFYTAPAVREYTWENSCRQFTALYHRILDDRPSLLRRLLRW